MNDSAGGPRVSIIMPVFNDGAFLEEAIASLLAQTEPDFELVVCDDASSDESTSIIRRFAGQDARIKALYNDQNRGVCFSRDRAIAVAEGEWITLLDGDDYYLPERLHELLRFAGACGADMVADGFILVDENSRETGEVYLPTRRAGQGLEIEDYVRQGMPSGRRFNPGYLKPMIRRDFIQSHGITYLPDAWCGQDFVFYLTCLLHGADWRLMDEAFYCYRKYPRPRTLESKLKRTERHRENNRHMIALADGRQDIVQLLQKRDRYFDYAVRYQRLSAAAKRVDVTGMLGGLQGGPEYWGFCLNMLSRRVVNRLQRLLRRPGRTHPKRPRTDID
ncbi:MAG: glycosyltransferase family 2 protein [Gammaproteobacteria bacterium]|nr:glycosyltransferase family 2 protein [Gammaproteobacteria bacterium]